MSAVRPKLVIRSEATTSHRQSRIDPPRDEEENVLIGTFKRRAVVNKRGESGETQAGN